MAELGNLLVTGASRFLNKINGSITGEAATAIAFSTAKAVTLSGDTTGTASSTGGWNITTKTTMLSTVGDQRAVATTPNSYVNKIIFQGLKTNSSFGAPSSDTYSYVVGLRGWSDNSGGDAHELAFNNTGIFARHGATTTWGSWTQLLDSSNYTQYTVTKTGVGASGTWGISITGNAATVNSHTVASDVPADAVFTDTHYTTHLYAGDGSAANKATTNTNTKLTIYDTSTARESITIKGTGATTVTSDANGVITINSTDNNTNTTYSFAGGTNKFTYTPSGGTATDVSITPSATITAAVSNPTDGKITLTGTNGTNKVTYSATHVASGVTAGTYGPSAAVTGTEGTTINVPQITVDSTGHVTSVTNRTLTNKNTNTTYSFAGGTNKLTVTPSGGTATSYTITPSATITAGVSNASGTKVTLNGTNGTNGVTYSATHATSGVTAGSYGPTADVTGTNLTTINVPQITVDDTGHVTSVTNRVLTNKDTHYATHLYAGSGTAANASTANGNTKITVTDESSVRNSVTIKGTGGATVTSDDNGVITVNSSTIASAVSGTAVSTSDGSGYVWYSKTDDTRARAYDAEFKYDPSHKILNVNGLGSYNLRVASGVAEYSNCIFMPNYANTWVPIHQSNGGYQGHVVYGDNLYYYVNGSFCTSGLVDFPPNIYSSTGFDSGHNVYITMTPQNGGGYAYFHQAASVNGAGVCYFVEGYHTFKPGFIYLFLGKTSSTSGKFYLFDKHYYLCPNSDCSALTILQDTITINLGTISSLPVTKNVNGVVSDMVCVQSILGTPSAQQSDWTITTGGASITVSGTISGSTTLSLVLSRSNTITAS